mgnify:CR=1 FL=1
MPPAGLEPALCLQKGIFKSLVSANFTTVAHKNPAYKALLLWAFTESRE